VHQLLPWAVLCSGGGHQLQPGMHQLPCGIVCREPRESIMHPVQGGVLLECCRGHQRVHVPGLQARIIFPSQWVVLMPSVPARLVCRQVRIIGVCAVRQGLLFTCRWGSQLHCLHPRIRGSIRGTGCVHGVRGWIVRASRGALGMHSMRPWAVLCLEGSILR
jgi:hypothetical protein